MRLLLLIAAFMLIVIGAVLAQGPKGGSSIPAPKPAPKPKPKPKRKPLGPDPCEKKKCGVGEDCRRSKRNPKVAECYCIQSCTSREFPDPLCTNTNQTYNSICDFERNQCYCKRGKGCKGRPGKYIVYYAECQGSYCNKKFDMIDYANRTAQWLRDTHAARAMIPSDFPTDPNEIMNPLGKQDRRVSAAMYNSPDGNAVYVSWWFCDLDRNKDGNLDRKELSVLTRALMPNEQCIQTFLSQCDKNSDSRISNSEWHATGCFKVTKGKKTCADINKLSSFI